MSRWVIVVTEYCKWNKDNPWVNACPVGSYPKAKEILDRYYSDFVEYYKARNKSRPMMPFDVKIEWEPEEPNHKMKLVVNVRDPQNKENWFISYEICRMIGVRTLDQRHRSDVHLAEIKPVFPFCP